MRTWLTKRVNKSTLLLRALVSAYILYLAYELIRDYETAGNPLVSIVAVIVFVTGGGLIFLTSVYKLIKKDYEDGNIEEKESQIEMNSAGEKSIAVDAGDEQKVDKDSM